MTHTTTREGKQMSGLAVWLTFVIEGETFEVQFPTNSSDPVIAGLDARQALRRMFERAADVAVITYTEKSSKV